MSDKILLKLPKSLQTVFGWEELKHYTAISKFKCEKPISLEPECIVADLKMPPNREYVVFTDGHICGPGIPNGNWYISFVHAKAAAIKEWEETIQMAKLSIASIRKKKAKDCEEFHG